MSNDPRVTFEFRTRGLARVKRDVQDVLNSARAGANSSAGRGTAAGSPRSASAERSAARAALVDIARRQSAYRALAAEAQRAEGIVTAAVVGGAGRRGRVAQDEARTRIRTWRDVGRMYAQVERDGTRAAEQGAARRQQLAERARERGGARGERLAGAVQQYGAQAHGMIQDARGQFAGGERAALRAFMGGGATSREANARVRELLAFSRDNGLNFGEVAQAAAASQGQFSTLQGANAGERAAAFQRFQASAIFARNSGNDLGEMTRLQGFFQQENFSAGLQEQLMRYTAGAANRGSVEAGTLTSQALQPIVSRIRTAQAGLGPNATEAQRQQVAFDTYRQGVAELQVTALGGVSARNGGNALATASRALTDETRQDKIFTNIQNARGLSRTQRTQLTSALFTTGRDGRRTMNTTNIMDFVERVQGVTGNNPTLLNNIFAGGGHGNPQAFLANQRNAMGLLMSVDGEGRNRVRQLLGNDVAMTDAQLAEGALAYSGDTTAQLNKEEGARMGALTDNTNAIVGLSNALQGWAARNPLLAPIAQGAGGLLAGKLLGAAGKFVLGGGAGGAGGGAGAGLAGGGLLATVGLGAGAVAATGAALALNNRDVNAATGTTLRQRGGAFLSGVDAQVALGAATDARTEAIGRESDRLTMNQGWNAGVLGGAAGPMQVTMSPAAAASFAEVLRASPLVVSLSPQAAAQAAGQARIERGAGERRQ